MDRLSSMAIFVCVAERGSFAAAAGVFDLSATMVAKHVRFLETQLGARLLDRTTRRHHLTEIGRAYLERCRDVLASVQAADQVAEVLRAVPQGTLRLTAPISWGTYRLTPVVTEYMAMYPGVRVELSLNDRVVDLAEEGFDCGIRSGPLQDERLVALPLRRARMLACASPAYLAQHGVPLVPTDLARHQLIAFSAWGPEHAWRFQRGDEVVQVPVQGRLAINNGQALLQAALAGAGVVVQADALLEPELAAGRLVRLLADWTLPSRPLHIVRLQEARPSAKLRSFVDFVLARLGEPSA